jgi:hypothetical protein
MKTKLKKFTSRATGQQTACDLLPVSFALCANKGEIKWYFKTSKSV